MRQLIDFKRPHPEERSVSKDEVVCKSVFQQPARRPDEGNSGAGAGKRRIALDMVMHMHYHVAMKRKPVVEADSSLTDRYQTTVPSAVRRALRLRRRDRIVYRVLDDGTVLLARRRVARRREDPVVGLFLAFLARDMAIHPERIRPVERGLVRRMRSLTRGVKVDLAAPLGADDA
jgi:antitoxin PrlF